MTAPETNSSPPRVFITNEKLRNGDTDQQGHINNAKIATFFESGRVEVLADAVLAAGARDVIFVVVRIEIDFKKELFYPGTVEVRSQVVHVGNSSFRFAQSLLSGEDEVAARTAPRVLMDRETRKPVAVPPAMRAFFGAPA